MGQARNCSNLTHAYPEPCQPSGYRQDCGCCKGGKRPFPVGSTAQLKDTYDRPIRDRRNVRCHKRKFQSCAAAQSAEVAVIVEHRRVHALYWLSAIVYFTSVPNKLAAM